MKTQNVFHFPDGSVNHLINTSYCDALFSIGDKIDVRDEWNRGTRGVIE